MKVIFIDSEEEQVKEIEIEDKLEEYYKHIGCDLIETVYTIINGKPIVIICDEEATLKEEVCKEGFILPDGRFIIGNAIIVGSYKKSKYFEGVFIPVFSEIELENNVNNTLQWVTVLLDDQRKKLNTDYWDKEDLQSSIEGLQNIIRELNFIKEDLNTVDVDFTDSPVSVEEVQQEIIWGETVKAPSQEEIDAAVENIARLNHLAKIEKDPKIKEAIEDHIKYVKNYIKGGSTIE